MTIAELVLFTILWLCSSSIEDLELKFAAKYFLVNSDSVPMEPKTGIDLDSDVAKVPVGSEMNKSPVFVLHIVGIAQISKYL